MKPVIWLFLLLFTFTTASAQTTIGFKNLPVAEFKTQINAAKNIILLDVRTPEEFAKGHLAGAVNFNFFAPDFKDKLKQLDSSKPVYVYCAVGGRSGKTAVMLTDLNRKEVYNMEGGFTAWQKANFPIAK